MPKGSGVFFATATTVDQSVLLNWRKRLPTPSLTSIARVLSTTPAFVIIGR